MENVNTTGGWPTLREESHPLSSAGLRQAGPLGGDAIAGRPGTRARASTEGDVEQVDHFCALLCERLDADRDLASAVAPKNPSHIREVEVRDRMATADAQRVVTLGSAVTGTIGKAHDSMYPLHRFVKRGPALR